MVLLVVLLTAGLVASAGAGCGARDDGLFGSGNVGGSGGDTDTGGSGGSKPLPPASTDKVDVLLVLDNSRSMADKQAILSLAVPELIASLINPACLDDKGVPSETPATPDDPCPAGFKRQFPSQNNIHIGVITTSLGGHGADVCSDELTNDHGRLIWRTEQGGQVSTYDGLGFLAWDPKGKLSPPGQDNPDAFVGDLTDMVIGAGQVGCGFEASHEAWYRFLVEPDPYQTIKIEQNSAILSGTDETLLKQRADFLRSDSLLMIMVLSDENDCSIRDGGQYYFAAQIYSPGTNQPYHLPKPRAACAEDPNDPCCRSCGQQPGEGCDDSKDDCAGQLEPIDDQINLRCWDQKRRFGIDFLQPIERYADGLREKQVADRHGNIVANPVFSDLQPGGSGKIRDERLVFLAALIGVPWQDIARRSSNGAPDLIGGKDAKGNPVGAFQSAAELTANNTWSLVLGNPENYHTDPSALPDDPLMIETFEPRHGTHPITGEAVAAPGAGYDANWINGHEYSIPTHSDLQYACVFELPEPRDCSDPQQTACDCSDPKTDNPLCQDPDNNKFGQIQYRAKAYPGIRHLQVAKAIGNQGVIGSICPAQLYNEGALDFGYRPTVRTLISSVASVLNK